MEQTDKKHQFDEKAKEAAAALLENFWILRQKDPDVFQKIRERETVLRRFFTEKLGFRFILHQYFAKLEKVPVVPEHWMGIQAFKSRIDYALFCCLLAFLESKSVDEQFLLSDLCEELRILYPGEETLDWTNYEFRKSLVRVLQSAKELEILKVVDGEITDFSMNENKEVLYEVPVVSRYFMRSYPKDFTQFTTLEDILETDMNDGDKSSGEIRRQRVYRQLFLSPVMHRTGKEDGDFLYLRNFRNRIRDDVEATTDFQFELYKNAAMLTMTENRARHTLFPDNKSITDIVLHFSTIVRRKLEEDRFTPNETGVIRMSTTDFEELVKECMEIYKEGWAKIYREASLTQVAGEILSSLTEWKMAEPDRAADMIRLLPAAGRITGYYPADFNAGLEEGNYRGN